MASRSSRRLQKPKLWMVLVFAALSLLGCAAALRPIEPPVVRLSGASLMDQGEVVIDLMVTNLNPMVLSPKAMQLQIRIDDQDWIATTQPVDWVVAANAREVVSFSAQTLPSPVQDWLDEVSQGQRANLPWAIELKMTLDDERIIETQATGFLYRSPGQPGRFR